jgi:hypothetical protein
MLREPRSRDRGSSEAKGGRRDLQPRMQRNRLRKKSDPIPNRTATAESMRRCKQVSAGSFPSCIPSVPSRCSSTSPPPPLPHIPQISTRPSDSTLPLSSYTRHIERGEERELTEWREEEPADEDDYLHAMMLLGFKIDLFGKIVVVIGHALRSGSR